MRHRLGIITEIIAPYRIPEFNALAAQAGIDLHVIFLAETDHTQRQWAIYRDEISFPYQVLPSWRRRLLGYNFLFNRGMKRVLEAVRPQVIICGGYNYVANWEALHWSRRNRVPFLLWVESNLMDRRSGNFLVETMKRTFLRRCTGFVAAGRSSSEYLSRYGVLANRVFVAPNAVGNAFFSAASDSARNHDQEHRESFSLPQRYFLFAGRLVEEKGIFDLLSAYGALAPEIRSKVGLVFVGDGSGRSALETSSTLISPGTVKIVGFVQREKLAIYYGLAEALVFPTHSDAWGLVVNEAMACGLPIIATDVAGCVADLVEPGENGLVTRRGDVSALTLAMATLASDQQLRTRMAGASRTRIAMFSPEAWANGIMKGVEANRPELHG